MAFAQITDHEVQALARLAVQYADAPRVRALVSAGASAVQTAEDVLWQLFTGRLLDSATGTQLDNLGAVVGQSRGGGTEAQFKALIRGRILANRSDNTPEALLGIVRAVLDDVSVVATLTRYAPASFVIDVSGPVSALIAKTLASMLADARAAGVGGSLVTSTEVAAETFAFGFPCDFLTALTGAGAGTLVVAGDAELFPASGTLRIDEGTLVAEDRAYTSREGSTFTLTGVTANAHPANASVSPVSDTSGAGFGDSTDPLTGGVFAGTLTA